MVIILIYMYLFNTTPVKRTEIIKLLTGIVNKIVFDKLLNKIFYRFLFLLFFLFPFSLPP